MAELFFGEYRFDTKRLHLDGPSGVIEIRAKTLELLTYLIENRNRFVPREELNGHLWPDVRVTDSSLTQCVSELRHALGDSSREQRFIETRIKMGYRFAATVYHRPTERLEPLPPPADLHTVTARDGIPGRVWPLLVVAGALVLAATGWWLVRTRPDGPPTVVVSLVASTDAELQCRQLADEVRRAVVRRLMACDRVHLASDVPDGLPDNVLDLELACAATGQNVEISALLRDRSRGTIHWGWTWVVPEGDSHRDLATEVARRVENSISSILDRQTAAP